MARALVITRDAVFAYKTAGQAINATQPANVDVVFDTEVVDLTSAFTSNTYTCKNAGTYNITFSGTITKSSGTAALNSTAWNARILKNGSGVTSTGGEIQIDAGPAGAVGPGIPFSSSVLVTLAVNDTIAARLVTNFSGGNTWVGNLIGPQITINWAG